MNVTLFFVKLGKTCVWWKNLSSSCECVVWWLHPLAWCWIWTKKKKFLSFLLSPQQMYYTTFTYYARPCDCEWVLENERVQCACVKLPGANTQFSKFLSQAFWNGEFSSYRKKRTGDGRGWKFSLNSYFIYSWSGTLLLHSVILVDHSFHFHPFYCRYVLFFLMLYFVLLYGLECESI